MSRIGNAPVTVPSGVEVTVAEGTITVKGPKGTLSRTIPGGIEVAQEDGTLTFARPDGEPSLQTDPRSGGEGSVKQAKKFKELNYAR